MSNPSENLAGNAPETKNEKYVAPFFCCDMKYNSFFLFIIILDIISYCLNIIGTRSTIGSVLISIPLLVIASICLHRYNNDKGFGTDLHVCYAITRIVFSSILLAGYVLLLILCIFSLATGTDVFNINDFNNVRISPLTIFLIVILILTPFVFFSMYWSLLLNKVTKEERRLRLSLTNNEELEKKKENLTEENVEN